jgi:hypothetical protein
VDLLCLASGRVTDPARPAGHASGPAEPVPRRVLVAGVGGAADAAALDLRDVVIVSQLELELDAGFTVLTGETGAGKSILIDALQLALGNRADAALVREGAARAEVSAEFDSPPSLAALAGRGRLRAGDAVLLLRRTVDAQGKSRAWINGSAATWRSCARWPSTWSTSTASMPGRA